jgi:hypothetical protein
MLLRNIGIHLQDYVWCHNRILQRGHSQLRRPQGTNCNSVFLSYSVSAKMLWSPVIVFFFFRGGGGQGNMQIIHKFAVIRTNLMDEFYLLGYKVNRSLKYVASNARSHCCEILKSNKQVDYFRTFYLKKPHCQKWSFSLVTT